MVRMVDGWPYVWILDTALLKENDSATSFPEGKFLELAPDSPRILPER